MRLQWHLSGWLRNNLGVACSSHAGVFFPFFPLLRPKAQVTTHDSRITTLNLQLSSLLTSTAQSILPLTSSLQIRSGYKRVLIPTMTWPDPILRQFQSVRPNPAENDFHGPYNMLLNYPFPIDSPYAVVPQYLQPGSRDSSDQIMTFEITLANQPGFILALKNPEALRFVSSRGEADDQIRRRISDLCCKSCCSLNFIEYISSNYTAYCPIPRLHAVSAVETRLCFYQRDATDKEAEIDPLAISRHPARVNDTTPEKRWDYEVLDAEGEEKFRSIVEEIKEECAKLL